MRFELENIDFCRKFAKQNENPANKRNYYGLACTMPKLINELPDYEFKFSPDLKSTPPNYFHCDIYDNFFYKTEIGQAKPAEMNLRIEQIRLKWKVNEDTNDALKHDLVCAP
jgi:hypothetical protein